MVLTASSEPVSPKVTIVLPHYKTLELTKLCLRLLRKYTDLNQARILVIDNGSQDESTEYLKSLSWIQLWIRDISQDPTPWESHGNALTEALAQIETPYMLIMHTDNLVKKADWLDYLLHHIEDNPKAAGVGSWRLELEIHPWYKRFLKQLERYLHLFLGLFGNKRKKKLYGTKANPYYLRSHCALYRTAALREHKLQFMQPNSTVGRELHRQLVALGYEMVFIPTRILKQYMDHISHATMVLNRTEENMRIRNLETKRTLKRIEKALAAINAEAILAANEWDQ